MSGPGIPYFDSEGQPLDPPGYPPCHSDLRFAFFIPTLDSGSKDKFFAGSLKYCGGWRDNKGGGIVYSQEYLIRLQGRDGVLILSVGLTLAKSPDRSFYADLSGIPEPKKVTFSCPCFDSTFDATWKSRSSELSEQGPSITDFIGSRSPLGG